MFTGVTYNSNSGSVLKSRNLHTPLMFTPKPPRNETGAHSVYWPRWSFID